MQCQRTKRVQPVCVSQEIGNGEIENLCNGEFNQVVLAGPRLVVIQIHHAAQLQVSFVTFPFLSCIRTRLEGYGKYHFHYYSCFIHTMKSYRKLVRAAEEKHHAIISLGFPTPIYKRRSACYICRIHQLVVLWKSSKLMHTVGLTSRGLI